MSVNVDHVYCINWSLLSESAIFFTTFFHEKLKFWRYLLASFVSDNAIRNVLNWSIVEKSPSTLRWDPEVQKWHKKNSLSVLISFLQHSITPCSSQALTNERNKWHWHTFISSCKMWKSTEPVLTTDLISGIKPKILGRGSCKNVYPFNFQVWNHSCRLKTCLFESMSFGLLYFPI